MKKRREKWIDYFDLIDAFKDQGCPLCNRMKELSLKFLDNLFYERVTDVWTGAGLTKAKGFCNWHAWISTEISNSNSGIAIIYKDLLDDEISKLSHYAATVGEVLEAKAEKNGYFARLVEEAKEMAAKEGVVLHPKVVAGHEVETIVNYSRDHHFNLLVIGFMGHSKIYDRVWGSTSQNIARLVPCTVMVVK
jgi:nucleotide-binding universal stress UspA family protein